MDLTVLLARMVEKNASDLFISEGAPPVVKAEGRSSPLEDRPLDAATVSELCYSVTNDDQSAGQVHAGSTLDLPLDSRSI